MWQLSYVALCAFSLLQWACCGHFKELEHTSDSLETVKERVKEKKAVLVDVRDLVEWNAGHVKGAIHLPFRDLQDKLDKEAIREKLDKDLIVYTYCVVGFRSLKAGVILEKAGYDVRPLKPGYEELLKAGFENEKPK
jgi:phage shock protein E